MADQDENKLEGKVSDKESKGFMRKAWDLGFNTAFSAGATALAMIPLGATAPIIGGALGSGLLVGGLLKKGKSLYDTVNDAVKGYGAVNTVLYPMVALGNLTFPLFSFGSAAVDFLAKSVYAVTAYNAAFVGLFKGADHLMEHKLNPIGITDSIKDGYGATFKRLSWAFAPGYLLVANGIPVLPIGGYDVPTFAANALPVGVLNAYSPPGASKPANDNLPQSANDNYSSPQSHTPQRQAA